MARIQMTNLMCLDIEEEEEEGASETVVNFVSGTMAAITGDSYLLSCIFNNLHHHQQECWLNLISPGRVDVSAFQAVY